VRTQNCGLCIRQNRFVPDVLIELPDGCGVVRRDDGQILVTRDVSGDQGRALRDGDRYLPVKEWLDADHGLVGGLLPAGAVRVEVVDDLGGRTLASVGEGAYVAIVEHPNHWHDPVVCCRDAAGRPVRRPLPDYVRAPVLDAAEPCPACGLLDYEECVPTEPWRAGRPGPDGETIPQPIVVCRVCGHEQAEGSILRISSPDDGDEQARAQRIAQWRADRRVQRWYENKLTLRAVTFPIYAADGWPAQMSGSGSRGDDLTELRIAHFDTEDAEVFEERPRIEVITSTAEPHRDALGLARLKLEEWVRDEIDHPRPPEQSDAAFTLWLRAIDRRQRAAALTATRADAEITIDAVAHTFLTLTTPSGRWVAVRHEDGLTLTIAARGVSPAVLRISSIPDLAARLLGPEPDQPQQASA